MVPFRNPSGVIDQNTRDFFFCRSLVPMQERTWIMADSLERNFGATAIFLGLQVYWQYRKEKPVVYLKIFEEAGDITVAYKWSIRVKSDKVIAKCGGCLCRPASENRCHNALAFSISPLSRWWAELSYSCCIQDRP